MVHADLMIANAGQTLFACANLATPLGTYKHAVLRDQDIAQLDRPLTAAELRTLMLQHPDRRRVSTEEGLKDDH